MKKELRRMIKVMAILVAFALILTSCGASESGSGEEGNSSKTKYRVVEDSENAEAKSGTEEGAATANKYDILKESRLKLALEKLGTGASKDEKNAATKDGKTSETKDNEGKNGESKTAQTAVASGSRLNGGAFSNASSGTPSYSIGGYSGYRPSGNSNGGTSVSSTSSSGKTESQSAGNESTVNSDTKESETTQKGSENAGSNASADSDKEPKDGGNSGTTEEKNSDSSEPAASGGEGDGAKTEAKGSGGNHEHDFVLAYTKNPTCIDEGYEVYLCECGKEYKMNYLDPVPHLFADWYVVNLGPNPDDEMGHWSVDNEIVERSDCGYCMEVHEDRPHQHQWSMMSSDRDPCRGVETRWYYCTYLGCIAKSHPETVSIPVEHYIDWEMYWDSDPRQYIEREVWDEEHQAWAVEKLEVWQCSGCGITVEERIDYRLKESNSPAE